MLRKFSLINWLIVTQHNFTKSGLTNGVVPAGKAGLFFIYYFPKAQLFMKLISFLFSIFILIGGFFPGSLHDKSAPNSNVFLGDPFVLLDSGTYYMYGTHNSDRGIEVYTSDNLRDWKGPVGATDGFALHESDGYGETNYWAPEVYEINNKYYMFFSVEEHMAVAVSDRPKGPFVQKEPSVLRDHKSIDHHLFIDDDGTKYIYFANFKAGLEILGAELNDDFSSIKEETLTKVLVPSQDWEKSLKEPVGRVNEGPFVVKKEGTYYMTYSANHYASQDYGIGLAHAEKPLGNWTKSADNPVIQNPDTLVGTGHSSFFTDKNGALNIVYHAHHNNSEVHPRKVFLNQVEFVPSENGRQLKLKIKSPRIKPTVESKNNVEK
jgi:beta-xylosidase